MNEKELQRISQQAARVGMDVGTTTEAFRRVAEMSMPTRELANNSPEVDRDNGELISRREATQTALDFIVEYFGGAFDEDFQKKLMERMNALPSKQPEYEELTPEEAASEIAIGSIMSTWYWLDDMIRLKQMGYAICKKHCKSDRGDRISY